MSTLGCSKKQYAVRYHSNVNLFNNIHFLLFQVGWSTARDYYTFLWSPMPENYVEGSTVNCVLAFQGMN